MVIFAPYRNLELQCFSSCSSFCLFLCSRTLPLISGFLCLHKKSVLSLKFSFLDEKFLDIFVVSEFIKSFPYPQKNLYFLYSVITLTAVPLK